MLKKIPPSLILLLTNYDLSEEQLYCDTPRRERVRIPLSLHSLPIIPSFEALRLE